MSDPVRTWLPADRQPNATDCQRLIDAIQRGEVDAYDLKNEIGLQRIDAFHEGLRAARAEQQSTAELLEPLVNLVEKLKGRLL